jgi:hypothetical protein
MQSAQGCPIAEGNYSTAWGSIGETFLKNSCGCSYNPPLSTTTKPTTTNVSAKFDGGFNYVNGGCGDNGFLGL